MSPPWIFSHSMPRDVSELRPAAAPKLSPRSRELSEAIVTYLREHEDSLLASAGPDRMPDLHQGLGGRQGPEPLGCGMFGCVYAVPQAGRVLKVSFDVSEGRFVGAAIGYGSFPSGIVRYDLLVEDEEAQTEVAGWFAGYDASVGPIYLMWREEAFFGQETEELRAQVASELADYRTRAIEARTFAIESDLSQKDRDRRNRTAMVELKEILDRGSYSSEAGHVLEACRFYLRRGWVLVDLFEHNTGVVRRGDVSVCVITDPGHAADFRGSLLP